MIRFSMLPRFFILLLIPAWAQASSVLPSDLAQDYREAQGICLGEILAMDTIETCPGGPICTRARVLVKGTFKGVMPEEITVVQRGGSVGRRGEDDGLSIPLHPGEERVFFLNVNKEGRFTPARGAAGALKLRRLRDGSLPPEGGALCSLLRALQEAAPVQEDLSQYAGPPVKGSDVAASGGPGGGNTTGLLVGDGFPSRFPAVDRGQAIGYLVDASLRPAGVSQVQGLTAVQNALAAWTAITGMKFRFDGFETFTEPPNENMTEDGRLRIALHDSFVTITSNSVLGLGGRRWSVPAGLESVGGGGGQVAGQEFHRSVNGSVRINQRASATSNLKSLEEVLCHEVGHALGLAHSSEASGEADPLKKQAVMYYTIHGDNRGASTNAWDSAAILKCHPLANTPPWVDPRYLLPISGSIPLGTINTYTVAAFDRQTAPASLTFATTLPSNAGAFTLTGTSLAVTAPNSTDATVDPATGSYYRNIYYRAGDGVNCSPWELITIYGWRRDTRPAAGSDGLPDSWMTAQFGNIDPAAGAKRGAADDFDGDGFTNLQEYRMGTDPKSAASKFEISTWSNGTLQWPAAPYEYYIVDVSSGLAIWSPWSTQIATPATWPSGLITAGASGLVEPGVARRFTRVRHIR